MAKLLRLAIVAHLKYDGSMPLLQYALYPAAVPTHTAGEHAAILLEVSYDGQPQ